jgi:hypothetical protein
MILLALFLGVILIVAAIRNSQRALFSALKADVPEYLIWAAAIFAVGAIGYIKPAKPIANGLLVLMLTAIILANYKGIIAGFDNAWKNPGVAQGGGQGMSDGGTTSGGAGLPNISGMLPDIVQIGGGDFGSTSGGLESNLGMF